MLRRVLQRCGKLNNEGWASTQLSAEVVTCRAKIEVVPVSQGDTDVGEVLPDEAFVTSRGTQPLKP